MRPARPASAASRLPPVTPPAVADVSRTHLGTSLAYCTTCEQAELARIVAEPDGVFLERLCPHGVSGRARIAVAPEWYRERTARPALTHAPRTPLPARRGCPHDCGPCTRHANELRLPIFSITNDCNLNCPKCFTFNRPDLKYYKSVGDTRTIIRHILERTGGVELINLTGGEPTLHPRLFQILRACQQPGIGRVTMNTNGLRLAQEPDFARRLRDSGVQPVLSLDTLDSERSRQLHGRDITELKRRALAVLEELNIPTTLLCVCAKGVNEADVAEIVRVWFRRPFVRSITIQTMTFTGQNGSRFLPREHLTLDEVERLLAGTGEFHTSDFFALGSYHPLCYSVAYYLFGAQQRLPLRRLLDGEALARFTAASYLLNADADLSRELKQGIDRLWADGADPATLRLLREFVRDLYPPGTALTANARRERAERRLKMIYIHAHMDADNFDIDRLCHCGDLVPDESGRMVPACSYNLIYRRQDPRFWVPERSAAP